MMSTGFMPGRVAGRIFYALESYAEQIKLGYALGDNVGYAVKTLRSGRQSFSPDVSFYTGALPENEMGFIDGAPTFAVEVRSECDYRPGADLEMAAKRADYFEAGTLVVWDVDTWNKCVYCYRKSAPQTKEVFVAGQFADAEPAVPGWRMSVDAIFRK